MRRLIWESFLVLCFGGSSFVYAQSNAIPPLRIGMMSDREEWRTALELAEVDFSAMEEVEVVDRSSMGLQLEELGLNSGGFSQAESIQLGRSLRADGLVRLQSVNEQGDPRLVLTLSGVRMEAILSAELIENPPKKPAELAGLISGFLTENLPLLRVDPSEVRTVTLLPLQLKLSQLDSLALETRMTRRMTSRLIRSGGVVVLDRERAGDFVFDRFFSEGATGEFWNSGVVFRVSVESVEEGTEKVRAVATLQYPGGETQVIQSEAFIINNWMEGLDRFTSHLHKALKTSEGHALSEDQQANESKALGVLAMRLYPFDVDRAYHYAELAYSMGNRSRDVLIIRTQTRLQDMMLAPRKAVMPIMKGPPPVLMRLGTFHIDSKYNDQVPDSVTAALLREITSMQWELLQCQGEWSQEDRGTIPLKTVLLEAMSIQVLASSSLNWDDLLPLSRKNAEAIRAAVNWLKANGEYSNDFLLWQFEGSTALFVEDPTEFMESAGRPFIFAKKFDPKNINNLKKLAGLPYTTSYGGKITNHPVTHSKLVPYEPPEWVSARKKFFQRMSESDSIPARTYFLYVAVHGPALLPNDWSTAEVENYLNGTLIRALADGDGEALPYLRELALEMESNSSGVIALMVDTLIARTSVQVDVIRSEESKKELREKALEEIKLVRSVFAEEFWKKIPRDRLIAYLQLIAQESLIKHLGELWIQEQRDWLQVLGAPMPSTGPALEDIDLYRPMQHTKQGDEFIPKPGHLTVRNGVTSFSRDFHLYSLNRFWAWDRHDLTLHGWDPKGERPMIELKLPEPETPLDTLLYFSLMPLCVGEKWAVFQSKNPVAGRGRWVAFRRSDGLRKEYFPASKGEPTNFNTFGNVLENPMSGHIHGDVYYYCVAKASGWYKEDLNSSSQVMRLDLLTGEQTVLMQKKEKGPFPYSKNPPDTQGHWMKWGESESALLEARAMRKEKSVQVTAHIYNPESGEWREKIWWLPELFKGNNQHPRGSFFSEMPGVFILGNRYVFDHNQAELLPLENAEAGILLTDPKRMADRIPNNPHEVLEGMGVESNYLKIAGIVKIRTPNGPLVSYQKVSFDAESLEAKAWAGDAEAAFTLYENALSDYLESFEQQEAQNQAAQIDNSSIYKAVFWCRLAADLKHPRASGALALLVKTQYRGYREPKISVPWEYQAIEQEDPWGYFVAALYDDDINPSDYSPYWEGSRTDLMLKAAETGLPPALEWATWTGRLDEHQNPSSQVIAYAAALALEEIIKIRDAHDIQTDLLERAIKISDKRALYREPEPKERDSKYYTPTYILNEMSRAEQAEAKSYASKWVPEVVKAWKKRELHL